MLVAGARRYVEERAAARSPQEAWCEIAGLGWLALPVQESDGGLGGRLCDAALLSEELGRGRMQLPYVACGVVPAGLLSALGSREQRTQHLAGLMCGASRWTLAHAEAGRALRPSVACSARWIGDTWRLHGEKCLIEGGAEADFFLVSAHADDGCGQGLLRLFLVPRDAAGVALRDGTQIDGTHVATLVLDGVVLEHLAVLGEAESPCDALPCIETAIDRAGALLMAESVGHMRALVAATREYARERRQFGKALTDNQVIKHRLVDMAVRAEVAAAAALHAVLVCDAPAVLPANRGRAVSGARQTVAQAGRFVAEAAVQVHGAMGMTEELGVGAHLKRLMVLELLWGTTSEHMALCAEQVLAGRPSPFLGDT